MLDKLDNWHKTKLGLLVFAVVELLIAYIFVSLSISYGNLWWYLFATIFAIGSVQNLFKLIGSLIRDRR